MTTMCGFAISGGRVTSIVSRALGRGRVCAPVNAGEDSGDARAISDVAPTPGTAGEAVPGAGLAGLTRLLLESEGSRRFAGFAGEETVRNGWNMGRLAVRTDQFRSPRAVAGWDIGGGGRERARADGPPGR